ncbi:MAG: DUF4823 domain-containing protein [Candidatus Hodarchaeota archaeon]
MKSIMLCVFVAFFATGCAASYKYADLKPITAKLDSTKGVLISTPQDGWYENTEYPNSGRMTANAIRAAFSKYSSTVDVVDSCHGENCLNSIDSKKYGYYVKPDILLWEERATEWSGKPDKIEIQIVIFEAATKEEIANTSYTGKSKWATLGGDHPQDLLPEPTNQFVGSLYK